MFTTFMDAVGLLSVVAPLAETNELTLCIQKRDVARARELMSQGADPRNLGAKKCTVLHLAVNYEATLIEECLMYVSVDEVTQLIYPSAVDN